MSNGTCDLCDKNVSPSNVTRHLRSCAATEGRPQPHLHVRVDGGRPYWLHLAVDPARG